MGASMDEVATNDYLDIYDIGAIEERRGLGEVERL
jgi:hypothetical protein